MRAGASAHELATVSRLQPDHSVRAKAMTGIGQLRTLQLEACRLQLEKAVRSVACTSTSLTQAMQRIPPTANAESQHARRAQDARRAQAINRAKTLEATTSQKYRQGKSTLLAAVQEAVAARAMAAGAAARMTLVDLYLQGAQCMIVSKDLCLAEGASVERDTHALTNIGRQMVQEGINECRTVASISLGSVRQQHEEHVETSMKHLLHLDETMKGISQMEVDIVMAVAADPGLSGGVTTYHKCPNGHVYGVGGCGRLNGSRICPECGLAIGGRGYH
ncbi:unnamed protein product [Ectocarpus sp. CCAP 1310/34]|nr:unnamed protein product [Ectocarpus sp. CCAP 1310/34]